MYDVGWLLCPQIHDFEGKELNSMRTKSCLRNVVFHRHKVGHEWTCLSFTLRIIDLMLVAVNIVLDGHKHVQRIQCTTLWSFRWEVNSSSRCSSSEFSSVSLNNLVTVQ